VPGERGTEASMKQLPLLVGFAVVLCLSSAFGQHQASTSIEIEDLMNSAKVSATPRSVTYCELTPFR
jgi:hypothetical protein